MSTLSLPVRRDEAREPIAIVGIGCRFPGEANSPDAYWRLLRDGIDAIDEIPSDRFDVQALYDPRARRPGKIATRWGGFLGQIDRFDAGAFGVSPREAERMDPQQRLLLEVAWEGFEDAGIPFDALRGTRTGVFVGQWLSDYEARLLRDAEAVDFYMTTGTGRYSSAGRLSYTFDLRGASVSLDAACSSSLVAVHMACRSLWLGESDLALAGGVNVILQPQISIAYSQAGMLAPDGRCKFGDTRANGYVRSEGCGLVVLKPLARAKADGDAIYAVIRGSAVTNDGRSGGSLGTPGRAGQEEMLRAAYRDAGIAPAEVQYVEAHGTGTATGDPTELGALGAVLGEGRAADTPCLVGSVKTQIGHTEGAAGVAGLIKVALALHHATLPATLHLDTPNPNVDWTSLLMNQKACEWPARAGSVPTAGVSSFGIAGTNAHVVLQAAPAHTETADEVADSDQAFVLPLSARSEAALADQAQRMRDWLASSGDGVSLRDICAAASHGRTHHEHRLAIVAASREQARDALGAFAAGEPHPRVHSGRAERRERVAFVFSGHGSQWLGMGRELFASEPVFRAAIEDCEQAMRGLVDWSLREQLLGEATDARLGDMDVVQPAIFAIQVGLARMWQAWGIEPEAVVGHSMGEVAAAHLAGALSLDDAARVICERSRLMRTTSGKGGMALVELSLDEARAALAGREAQVTVAVNNSPRSVVLSGDVDALEAVLAELEARQVFCRRIKVDVASHSPQMQPLCAPLQRALQDLQPAVPRIPFYSTVDASSAAPHLDGEYWVRNLRRPVLFADAVRRLIDDGYAAFVEISPHPLLTQVLQAGLHAAATDGLVVSSLRRSEDARVQLLDGLAALYRRGFQPAWPGVAAATGRHVRLPGYAWQRERFWLEVAEAPTARRRPVMHALLGERIGIADRPDAAVWETELRRDTAPEFWAHRLGASVVLPAATLLEFGLAVVAAEWPGEPAELHDVRFERPLLLDPDGAPHQVQVVFSAASGAWSIFGRPAGASAWTLHAQGRAVTVDERQPLAHVEPCAMGDGDLSGEVDSSAYARLAERGVHFEPSTRRLSKVRARHGEATADLHVPEFDRAADVTLSAALQLAALSSFDRTAADDQEVYLPSALGALRVRGELAASCRATSRIRSATGGGSLLADVALVDDHDEIVLQLEGLRLQRMSASVEPVQRWLHTRAWRPAEPLPTPSASGLLGVWHIVGEAGEFGTALAERLRSVGADVRCTPELPEAATVRGVVHVCAAPTAELDDLEERAGRLCGEALRTIQSSLRAGSTPRVWFVTTGGQATSETDQPDVAHAAVFGLARAAFAEQPDLCGGLIDLDPRASVGESVELLIRELVAEQSEVAFRDGGRRVPGFELLPSEAAVEPLRLRPDAAYLITGGLGGIGLRVADRLVTEGARRLILVGRTALPPRVAWRSLDPASASGQRVAAIRALEARGATVQLESLDIADRAQVRQFVENYVAEARPPIRGVIHAAGVVDNKLVTDLDPSAVAAVLRPKAVGAWTLEQHLDGLDFSVGFSSIGALIGLPGQAAYAAANAALDAVMHVRRARGRSAVSLNWGPWAEVGFAATEGGRQAARDLEHHGLRPIDAVDALDLLGGVLANPRHAQLAILPGWSTVAPDAESTADATAPVTVRDELAELEPAALRDRLETHVRGRVAEVLRLAPNRVDPSRPLGGLGVDSLMAQELRRLLEADLGLALSATLVWNYPTVGEMAAYLAARITPTPEPVDQINVASPEPLVGSSRAVAALSDDEALALLLGGRV